MGFWDRLRVSLGQEPKEKIVETPAVETRAEQPAAGPAVRAEGLAGAGIEAAPSPAYAAETEVELGLAHMAGIGILAFIIVFGAVFLVFGPPQAAFKPIECKEGEKLVNEKCIANACASTEECPGDSICTALECVKLNCGEAALPSNHECVAAECVNNASCPLGTTCQNLKCVAGNLCRNDLDCPDTLQCDNKTALCVPPVCGEDSFPGNHSCVKYECVKDTDCGTAGICSVHECVVRACAPGEYFIENKCFKAACGEDKDCEDGIASSNNTCINNGTAQAYCRTVWNPVKTTPPTTVTLYRHQTWEYDAKKASVNLTEVLGSDSVKVVPRLWGSTFDESPLYGPAERNFTALNTTGQNEMLHITLNSADIIAKSATLQITITNAT
jgi:hypothetical protein